MLCFGENGCGVLGFGHDRQVKQPKIVKELCDKRIIKFSNGINHVIVLPTDGKLLMWSLNVATIIGK
jgi:alpha-tubulin suppressor-like RCC1 family protein